MRVLLRSAAVLLALACHSTAFASSFSLSFHSEPGDWVGQGQDVVLTNDDVALYDPTAFDNNSDGLVDFVRFVSQGLGSTFFILDVGTSSFFNQNPGNLLPGVYLDAQRASFADVGHPGLDFTFDHRGSNTLTGSFTVLDAVFSGLTIERFEVTFEQHSEGFEPGLFGTFAYDARGTQVPEPATFIVMGAGLGALGWRRRRARLRPPA